MKQGGIAAWNIAPLFKGNVAPCLHLACALPAPCLRPARGLLQPACGPSTLPGPPPAPCMWLAAPCRHPARGTVCLQPAGALPTPCPLPCTLFPVPLPPCTPAKGGSCLHQCPVPPCAAVPVPTCPRGSLPAYVLPASLPAAGFPGGCRIPTAAASCRLPCAVPHKLPPVTPALCDAAGCPHPILPMAVSLSGPVLSQPAPPVLPWAARSLRP